MLKNRIPTVDEVIIPFGESLNGLHCFLQRVSQTEARGVTDLLLQEINSEFTD